MNLHYVSNARIPSERANTLQTMKMCEAFADAGAKVTLLHPYRVQPAEMKAVKDVWAFYGVRKDAFRIRRVPALDLLPAAEKTGIGAAARGAFLLQTWTYAAVAAPLVALMKRGVVFTREIFAAAALLPMAGARGLRLVYEAHTLPNAKLNAVVRRLDCVAITGLLGGQLRGIGVERVLVAPDGVDLSRYERLPSRDAARRQLGWDGRPTAVYTGQLFRWKGVDAIVGAAKRLPGVRFVVVGGTGEELEKYRKKAKGLANLEAVGQVPPTEVPLRTRAADVLLLPNSAEERISREHTSPLKLFEYMASGAPIVASDLPSLREVLGPRNALLVAPDDDGALAAGILDALDHPAESARRAAKAREDVEGRTWLARARAILEWAGA